MTRLEPGRLRCSRCDLSLAAGGDARTAVPLPEVPGASDVAGLCDTCLHQKLVESTRGSVFSMCLRSKTEAAYPKYPRLPVIACPGYEPRA